MSVFLIAEIGPNHNGNEEMAFELVEKLAASGADAIKFQLSIPENLHSLDSMKAKYQESGGGDFFDPLDMSRKLNLSFDAHARLANRCAELGVEYMCTGFDLESLKFLNDEIGIKRFKIPSGELLTIDILEYVAHQGKPIILSTGMATYSEIAESLSVIDPEVNSNVTILHCVSNYPAPPEDVHLGCMDELKKRFGRDVGFSDHTIGNEIAFAAVALGAKVVEKHVTLDKRLPGPDHRASATVEEFGFLVDGVRKIEAAMLGGTEKNFSVDEREIAAVARKSIVLRMSKKKGEILTLDDLCFRRPGTGISPMERDSIVGKVLAKSVEENRVLKIEDLIWE